MSGFDATPGEIRRLRKALSNAKAEERARCLAIVDREYNFYVEQHNGAPVDIAGIFGRMQVQMLPERQNPFVEPGEQQPHEDHGKRGL
jgi:hypothetical protein